MTEAATGERLAELVGERQPVVVLTGAGVSTESGIPDFRSPTGIWAEFDPREYATLGAFRADPEKVWRFYAPRFAMLGEARPNRAHRALAELERLGLVRAVVTQNIDLLHERAGSRDVVEVHGSIRVSHCLACGAEYPLVEVERLLSAGDGAPRCERCGTVLKPGVVFFDELLPEAAIDRAFALACEAALLLVVGSSLEVHPVAGLPRETLDAGGAVAVVNRDPTWVDAHAALVVRESAGDALAEAVARLRPDDEPVEGVGHDPAWAEAAAAEAARVAGTLDAVAVEHVGSTSVPGLAAKPVLDLLAGLPGDARVRPEQIRAMEALGYECLGEFGLPGRIFFYQDTDGRRTHHVHAVEHGGGHWRGHVAVRDYLRAHPDEAARYAEVKRAAAARTAGREAYWEAKSAYVEELERRALSASGRSPGPPS
ncbi:MAG TPA: NAD-dependent protein deacylase [Gaiellaceae bacterium]|nr:NAD-dependent protein deacylase [Gaiellaceae bacterium]